MQPILVPMYWERSDKYGDIILQTQGSLNLIEYSVKLIVVDPSTIYKNERLIETAKIISSHLKKYPANYLMKIIRVIFAGDFGESPSHILIVQLESHTRINTSNINSNLVATSAIKALNLCTSFGILSYTRFLLPNLDEPGKIFSATIDGGVISYSATDEGLIRIIPPMKMLGYQISTNWVDKQYFNELIDFFNNQERMMEENKLNFHYITKLVVDLFETTFAVKEYRPRFLLLAVIYETLFKDHNENITKIADRISKFLANNLDEQKQLYQIFYQKDPNILTFGKTRNYVTHGDIDLSREEVKTKYEELHDIIRRTLIQFFTDYSKEQHTVNYFSDLSSYIKNRLVLTSGHQ